MKNFSKFPQRIMHRLNDTRGGVGVIGREGMALARSLKSGQVVVKQNDEKPQLVTVSAPDKEPEPLRVTATG
jgi:hypothetical protein